MKVLEDEVVDVDSSPEEGLSPAVSEVLTEVEVVVDVVVEVVELKV